MFRIFKIFFADFKRKFNFTLKTMFTNIFLNIKVLLKKEKLKILMFFYLKLCTFCTELYILNEDTLINQKKNQVSTPNISFLTLFRYIYNA